MSKAVRFTHPEPNQGSSSIWPVFLPFQGCAHRCIYCAQDVQTGTTPTDPSRIFFQTRNRLTQSLPSNKAPPEIGFYGGTFTRLPNYWQHRFLAMAARLKRRGLVGRIRCSTRPDAVTPEQLRDLREQGLDMVELGIQSLDEEVLSASKRGYSASLARQACEMVRENGLELGAQMMPGLPGQSHSSWQREIRDLCRLRPDCVRLYPCLVLEGTVLARMWAQGSFRPWRLSPTIRSLSRAALRLWSQDIPVIRIGLAPEQDMLSQLLDGPWHPALGSLVRGESLFHILRAYAIIHFDGPVRGLDCPARYQGELWGHRGSFRKRLAGLGITPANTRFTEENHFTLYG